MIRSLFGLQPKVDVAKLLREGAVVLDVRTKEEFAEGHVPGAINIPLDELLLFLYMIPRGKPVLVCCQSGGRSAIATGKLQDHGFNAYNGGRWTKVQAALPGPTR